MVSATHYNANMEWGDDGNAEYRGYSAAMYGYKHGENAAVIALCDKLIPVTINGDYAKASLKVLRDAAVKQASGQKIPVVWSAEMSSFQPFKKLRMDILLNKPLPSLKPQEEQW